MTFNSTLSRYVLFLVLFAGCVLLAIALDQPEELTPPPWIAESVRDEEARRLGPGNPPGPESFSPYEAVERQPPVTVFEIVPAADAAELVRDDELVLAVLLEGQARAYPLNVMTGPRAGGV